VLYALLDALSKRKELVVWTIPGQNSVFFVRLVVFLTKIKKKNY
jgi:hypothetical protein